MKELLNQIKKESDEFFNEIKKIKATITEKQKEKDPELIGIRSNG
jgi:hypothetical protein